VSCDVYFGVFVHVLLGREAKGEEHPTKSRTLPGTPLRRKVMDTSLRVGLVINVLYYLRDKGSKNIWITQISLIFCGEKCEFGTKSGKNHYLRRDFSLF
jgi:hypothetical protein